MNIETLDKVQTGDKVVLCARGKKEVVKVTRTTATQIVCGFKKFWRKNGNRVAHDVWDFDQIIPWTPEIQQEIDTKERQRKLCNAVNTQLMVLQGRLSKLPNTVLEELLSTLKEYNNK